jgi:glycosyltransferase involved in cell wall biosynthesis
MPRVSVIIAALDCEAYIAEALGSVQRQSYGDWEIVVVDDGSSDRTSEIARSFPRVRLIANQENAGLPAARNQAIHEAGGELIAILDADDSWLPEYLEHQVGLFDRMQGQAGGRVGIVTCDAHLAGLDGRLRPGSYSDAVRLPAKLTVNELLRGNPIFVSVLAPRRVVLEAGGFDPELRRMPDWDLWLRIVERGYEVVTTPRLLCVYRVRPGSLSRDPYAMALEAQLVYRKALKRGSLTPRQRRIARRELRLQRAVERLARAGQGSQLRLVRELPLLARVAAENPRRWRRFAQLVRARDWRFARSEQP